MASIIKFEALCGAEDEGPLCYFLQLDDFKCLLDCGLSSSCDVAFVQRYKTLWPRLDCVLLSYPDLAHLGALPLLASQLDCPIFATVATYKMGQMFMYDFFQGCDEPKYAEVFSSSQSKYNEGDFTLFSLDDVDAAFEKITQLKYSQTAALTGRGAGIQVVPLPAGHMLGGAVWRIVRDGEEEIVYAVDFNHKRDRHLAACQLDKIQRPQLLITDALNATYAQPRRKSRDEELITTVLATLRRGGNVLVATDTAGRLLELALMFDTLWSAPDAGFSAYTLCLFSNVAIQVIDFAKSHLEWMSADMMLQFETTRVNPFDLKNVQYAHTMAELNALPEPKVVFASQPDLETGYARQVFVSWCEDSRHSIILSQRADPGTLAQQLLEKPQQLTLEVRYRVRLEGAVLEEWRAEEEKRLEALRPRDLSDEDEDEVMETTERPAARKALYPMYPCVDERRKYDDYGEITDLSIYRDEPIRTAGEPRRQESRTGLCASELPQAAPSRPVSLQQSLNVRAAITFIDYEGRSDGESVARLISTMRPEQVVLVHGSAQSCASLQKTLRREVTAKTYVARYGETLDCSSSRHMYQIRLSDKLATGLEFQTARDYELAWLDGRLDMAHRGPHDEVASVTPLLVPLAAITPHTPVLVNEPKLSDLKQLLLADGLNAEFSGGRLLVNDRIAVIRTAAGQIRLEGTLCDDFYKVRQILYGQFAIL